MKKNLIILIISAAMGIFATGIYNNLSAEKTSDSLSVQELQQTISEKILRFHVIANSNSTEDQDLKLKVKEYVAEYIEELLSDSDSLEESIKTINNHNEEIVHIAKEFVSECGFDYEVTGQIATTYFPIKTYGDIMLPAGDYTAYQLIIGNGTGANWWCILYPPLCFVDLSTGIVPDDSKDELKSILNDGEYTLITTGKPEITKVRFKYLTFLNEFLD
ncbi:MAG: stage II sporulation protein R [Lachnospiraceae bacterium]|nr:stage II sporulation protein R [Lachnospiraceae bacterium]